MKIHILVTIYRKKYTCQSPNLEILICYMSICLTALLCINILIGESLLTKVHNFTKPEWYNLI